MPETEVSFYCSFKPFTLDINRMCDVFRKKGKKINKGKEKIKGKRNPVKKLS